MSRTRENNKREKNSGRKPEDYKVTNSREDVVSDTKYNQKVLRDNELTPSSLLFNRARGVINEATEKLKLVS